ncbi:prepilin-type N-terminal cleavage/methylation domain-containing protein [Roseobacter sp.]|uniref:prepilin-type N-terminal cleavage/methylation domain-containing protein n=1 Tax=Roseobacter sp. TaxID=1907202 RepID=UPI0029672076|nr:prepilin-type N-terminal cleavage/methylation domain-containing protein [Roseobacter sp.]MDW3181807.1 prepilin-type N-terminal cleavage/methylation domain-containing protein [Roseobacter sp.]
MTRRPGTAGVTLVEMLVVLVLIGVLSGAVALGLSTRPSGDQAELSALKLSADLDHAVRHALDHQVGFGLKADPQGYAFLVPSGGNWRPHPDRALQDVKLFPRSLRISVQDHDGVVFRVSRTLVPEDNRPWRATLGHGASARDVIFDGVTARIAPAGGG